MSYKLGTVARTTAIEQVPIAIKQQFSWYSVDGWVASRWCDASQVVDVVSMVVVVVVVAAVQEWMHTDQYINKHSARERPEFGRIAQCVCVTPPPSRHFYCTRREGLDETGFDGGNQCHCSQPTTNGWPRGGNARLWFTQADSN